MNQEIAQNLRLSSTLRGIIRLTGSKSITNRVRVITYLCPGDCELFNMAQCDDAKAVEKALTSSGTADIGAAGTAMRFLTALFTLESHGERMLTGSQRMKQRPIGILVDALRQIGARIEYVENEGFPPLRILGQSPVGGNVSLPASVSSQYISALLLIAPMLQRGLIMTLKGEIASRPYINMTLKLMQLFGADASWVTSNSIEVKPKPYVAKSTFMVEPDWSGASYWYELVALSSDSEARIVLPGLSAESTQGDAHISEYFEPLGVHTTYDNNGIILTKCKREIQHVKLDLSNEPDMAQTLVVTSALLDCPFHISGLKSLRIKETDRIAALIKELHKLGYIITAEGEDTLVWNGEKCKSDVSQGIDTYDDHRMALAFAPCAYAFDGLTINHPEVVAKSYPNFWNDLSQFTLTTENKK